jgi:23S rRNA pseudouridine1911/1915/1917 synthase
VVKSALVPVVYEDDDVIVVDKPAGIATHSAASFDGDDVYNLLVGQGVQIRTSGDSNRQGIVSRLDVGTSGLVVVAKNEISYQDLKRQFQEHRVVKRYIALSHGHFTVRKGTFDAPISRHPTKRAIYAVVDGGKPAVTHFDVLREYAVPSPTARNSKGISKLTELEVQLETGRTHQIRVHFSAYGHPLVGDTVYGGKSVRSDALSRPFLHSTSLEFSHPRTNQLLKFISPLPAELNEYLQSLSALS